MRSTAADQGERLAGSSAAVLVVDTRDAQAQAEDLGALLSRQQGVNVQRAGGLGAQTRISLQGLGEDQIRFYVDGVPLAFTGLPESIAYVPVDLVLRAEIYRGVVPIRFGGDTLGGAIHLVQHPPAPGMHGSASLTLGTFDTQRAALRAQYLDAKTGLYALASGFLDHARNDYGMDGIEVPQRDGKKEPRRVYRLHDAYRAGFGQLELGVVDRPYAKRLALRGFVSAYDKEINHDLLMKNPYGEVLSRRRSQGALLVYEHEWWRRFGVDAKLGYAHRTRQLRDLGDCAYDWYLNCVSELHGGGEAFDNAANRKTSEHDLFLRLNLSLRLSKLAQFRASLAPTYLRSSSRDVAVAPGIPDLFAQDRQLFGFVTGLEYELDAFSGKLENVLFAKDYVQELWADATTLQGRVPLDNSYHRAGVGDALRLRLHDTLIGKLSYELGARMPDGNEVFGDGVFLASNLALKPESSHNVNAELRFSYAAPRGGSVELSASGFYRRAKDFIFLLAGPNLAQFQNLTNAEVKGVEGSARYAMPGDYLAVEGAVTWQDMRNHASSGAYAMFEGQRIPNRPYLFANLSLTGKLTKVAAEHDSLALTFRESYVAEFFRAFEVPGARERDVIPRQLVSSLALTYETEFRTRTLSASVECNNLTDAAVYDFFGVKRPGRSVMAKLMFRM
ncbi:MAG TPA: TonB-dependent receptor [Polyangiales bacterium]